MTTVMSNRHLQALGITSWIRRSSSAAKPAAVTVSPAAGQSGVLRLNRPQAAVGTVILEWPHGEMGLHPDDPGGSLLSSILEAMQLRCDCFQILQLDIGSSPPDPADLPLSGSIVLCFVENWPPKCGQHEGRHWVSVPTLQQMLSERQFKRQAWQQLKPWANKLK